MLHAATVLVGLTLAAALLMPSAPSLWIIPLAAACAAVTGWRFGALARTRARLPDLRLLLRLGANLGGALATARAALAADVALKPALVRLRARATGPDALAALAGVISSAPGANVVESDSDGLLVHVLNEDAVDGERLGAIEADVMRGEAPQ